MMKRTFDFVAAGLALLLLWPLMVIIAIAIKATSPGPVFYRGVRIGKEGKPFRIIKFRSMVVDAERAGPVSTADDDPRLTRIGRFIRKYKLDESAQLLNVLLGDMSLVGPRPEVQQFVDKYTEEEKELLRLRPGITDWASIWNSDEGGVLKGARDGDALYEAVIRPTKLKLQLRYLRSRTFLIDVKLLFCTVLRLVLRNYTPTEIADCPTYAQLRAAALEFIAEEATEPLDGDRSVD
jgi:lipopolysaccharide/colanic/teichoic acid biosynthesis glycosyltransferase